MAVRERRDARLRGKPHVSEAWCVVAAVDFSTSSRRALDLATAVSLRAEVPLLLLHVWNPNQASGAGLLLPAVASWIAEQRERLASELDRWAEQARSRGASVSCRVAEGVTSRAIPELARSAGAGLVVLGRRGSANLAHVLLGSVSERVAHLSPCPVLVVPEGDAPARAPRRLLVGIDFSKPARDAYRQALSLAEAVRASDGLLLLHVRPGPAALAHEVGADLAHESAPELSYRGGYPYDRDALQRWARLPSPPGVPVASGVVEGTPSRALLGEAQARDCDWVVVGLQGHTSLAALLMGSTADRVLKLADRPVLVVPASAPAPGEFSG
jgi:nucleotide-binding universal stress UspA family protein